MCPSAGMVSLTPHTVQDLLPSAVQVGAVSFQVWAPVATMDRVSFSPQPEQVLVSTPVLPQVGAVVCVQLPQLCRCVVSVGFGSVGAGSVGAGSVGFGCVGAGSDGFGCVGAVSVGWGGAGSVGLEVSGAADSLVSGAGVVDSMIGCV